MVISGINPRGGVVMKKHLIIAGVAVLGTFAACTSSGVETPVAPERNVATVQAVMPQAIAADTKVSVNSSGALAWQSGDAISVYASDGAFHTFDIQSGAGSSEAVFSNPNLGDDVTVKDVAVSPSTLSPSYDGSAITLNFPSAYAWEEGVTNVALVAAGTNGAYDFKHVGGVAVITYNNVPYTATRFRFTADVNITGSCEVSSDGEVTSVSGGKSVDYTFALDESAKMTFYVPLPVQTYSSFTIALYDEDNKVINGSEKSASTSVSVTRAKLLKLPAITIPHKNLAAQWKFEDTSNMLKASVGSALELSAGSVTPRTDGPRSSYYGSSCNYGIRTSTDGYLSANHGVTGNKWTISMYIRTLGTSNIPLVTINSGKGDGAQLSIGPGTSYSQLAFPQTGWTSGQLATPGYLGFNHIDLVNDNGTVKLYLNYLLVTTYDDTSNGYFTMTTGTSTFFSDESTNAAVDVFDLAVFNSALSRDELLAYAGLKAPDKTGWTVTSGTYSGESNGTWNGDIANIINDNGVEYINNNGATENLYVTIDMQQTREIGFISIWTGTPWANTGQKYSYLYNVDNGSTSIGFINKPNGSRNYGLVYSIDLLDTSVNCQKIAVVVNPSDRYNTTYIMLAEVSIFEKLY